MWPAILSHWSENFSSLTFYQLLPGSRTLLLKQQGRETGRRRLRVLSTVPILRLGSLVSSMQFWSTSRSNELTAFFLLLQSSLQAYRLNVFFFFTASAHTSMTFIDPLRELSTLEIYTIMIVFIVVVRAELVIQTIRAKT